jgi:hypothetical protein
MPAHRLPTILPPTLDGFVALIIQLTKHGNSGYKTDYDAPFHQSQQWFLGITISAASLAQQQSRNQNRCLGENAAFKPPPIAAALQDIGEP